MSSANERQVGGSHYKAHGTAELQHWDVVTIFKLDYFQAQITRYLFRWKDKNGLEDLEKARHYMDKYIEVHEQWAHHRQETPLLPEVVDTGQCDACLHDVDEHNEHGCGVMQADDSICQCTLTPAMIRDVEPTPAPIDPGGCSLELQITDDRSDREQSDLDKLKESADLVVTQRPIEGSLNVSEFGDMEVEQAISCAHCGHAPHKGGCNVGQCECWIAEGGEPRGAETRREASCPSCHHPTRLHTGPQGCLYHFSDTMVCSCPVQY